LQVRGKPEVLVELSIERLWRKSGDGEVVVTYHPGMLKGPKDYLALYEVRCFRNGCASAASSFVGRTFCLVFIAP